MADTPDDLAPAFVSGTVHTTPWLLIGRMDAKIDLLLLHHSQHGERLSHIEEWKNKASGFAIAAGTVAGAFGSFLPKLLGLLTAH